MSEDSRTLWVGNLHDDVTDELVYELFLQTGPIERLVFPTEGEGDEKKHRGHAYVLFKHAESVQFAVQVLDGTKLFGDALDMKARSMPVTYRSTPVQQSSNNRFRYDNSSLRGGFNRTNTWHGREDFVPRGRGGGGYRHKNTSNFNQQQQQQQVANNNYNQGGYNNNYSQMNTGYWMGQQQQQMGGTDSNVTAYSTNMDSKRQRLLQQQNLIIQGTQNQQQNQQQQQQQQQSMMTMNQDMYGMQQQNWTTSYSTTGTTANYSTDASSWNNMSTGTTSNMYQAYGDQYNNWYTQQ